MDHNLGWVIARSCKGGEIANGILWQGREVKVRQFHEIPTLRIESNMDFTNDSGSLGLYLQHIFKNQPWLLRESGETARNLYVHCSIVPFVNSAHIFTYTETTQTLLT